MAFLELPEDIIEENPKKKRQSRKGTKSKAKHRSESQKALIYVIVKRLKHINEDRKEPKKKMMSDKCEGLRFAKNYKKYKEKPLIIKKKRFENVIDTQRLLEEHHKQLLRDGFFRDKKRFELETEDK